MHTANIMIRQCALCRECSGAAYQSPPALYAGAFDAPIVVIAQNPGEIGRDDAFRLTMGKSMLKLVDLDESAPFLYEWYMSDYSTSHNASVLASVLGDDWLTSGQFLYTNAVRCRTEGNAAPSDEMVAACSTWTRKLLFAHKRSGVILLGNVAASQLLGKQLPKLPIGTCKRHPRFGLMLRLPHPSTWKSHKQLVELRSSVSTLLAEIGG